MCHLSSVPTTLSLPRSHQKPNCTVSLAFLGSVHFFGGGVYRGHSAPMVTLQGGSWGSKDLTSVCFSRPLCSLAGAAHWQTRMEVSG